MNQLKKVLPLGQLRLHLLHEQDLTEQPLKVRVPKV